MNRRDSGLSYRLLVLCAITGGSLFAQYGGPSVLSRGSLTSDGARGLPLGFQIFAGLSGVYDSGLSPVSVDKNGQLLSVDHLWGMEVGVGAVGTHRWAHASLGLTYNGAYRHYSQSSYYDGSDHVLSLDGRVDLNSRLSIITKNGAGTVSRTVSGFGGLVTTPDSLLGLPTNEIFDNRAYFLQTTDELLYRRNSRLSFVVGGDGFFVRRQSKSLVGSNGYGAHGNVAYRMDKAQTVDVAYVFLHFDYPRAFGETDIHQFTAGYARTLSRYWEMSLQGGAYRVDTIGVTSITLDPATAALFGQATTIEAFHKISYLPAIGATLRGKYKQGYVGFSYGRQPSPGNGVYLTSVSQNAGVTASWDNTTRWNVSAQFGANQYSSIGQQGLGTFRTFAGGAGTSYRLGQALHAALRFDVRQAQIDLANGYRRFGNRITLSLDYSPGNHPLALWR